MPQFAEERYHDILDEIGPLLVEHHAELAVYPDIPLAPRYDIYEKADAIGDLAIYTVREGGKLAGYSVFFIPAGHLHYATARWAMNDIIWIDPRHRNLGFGRAFVEFCDARLVERDVTIIHVGTKIKHPALLYLLTNCGYDKIEITLEKRLK